MNVAKEKSMQLMSTVTAKSNFASTGLDTKLTKPSILRRMLRKLVNLSSSITDNLGLKLLALVIVAMVMLPFLAVIFWLATVGEHLVHQM